MVVTVSVAITTGACRNCWCRFGSCQTRNTLSSSLCVCLIFGRGQGGIHHRHLQELLMNMLKLGDQKGITSTVFELGVG